MSSDSRTLRLHVWDSSEEQRYLVDGGALLSIIPPSAEHRISGPNGVKLRAANGTPIDCFGTVNKTVTINSRPFNFDFTVADVRQPILGADFLAEFALAPNHRDGLLIDLNTLNTIPATPAKGIASNPVNFVDQADDPFYQLLDSFPAILTPSFTTVEPKHGVQHHIPTTGRPLQSRARRLAPDKLAVAKEEIDKLCKLGVCKRAKSEWASPLMVARKPCLRPCSCTGSTPCGGWRVCGDFRRLNAQTPDDKYPVRSLQDFTAELHGKTIFSKIDLMKGYHQIPVAPNDICKTGVITPFGLFVFPRTPFGLKNAGQDFQRLMDSIFGEIPHVYVYLDDLLIASETPEQHLEDLRVVFKALADNGLVIQRKKCILGKPTIDFLGYKVDPQGISPLPDRVEAIRKAETPKTVKDLQRFLGMLAYYRRFMPGAAKHLFHLFDSLKGKPKTLAWTKECQDSFDAAKEALATATLLHHPRPNAQIALTTDASKFAVGGVLEQRGPQGWEPLAYYSSKLQPNQTEWPPYDRELLAAFKCVRHFRPFIEGRPITIYTDHQSLVPSMQKKSDPQTSRQAYQLACISEYSTDIRYIEGKSNVVADALSRPPNEPGTYPVIEQPVQTVLAQPQAGTASSNPHASDSVSAVSPAAISDLNSVVTSIGHAGINLQDMARDQPLDPDFRRISSGARSGLQFRRVELGESSIIVDVSNGPARPFVPFSWRRRVFDAIHGLGHPGVERTRQTVASKFVWPSLREDVSRWARECVPCQRSKVLRNTVPPIGDFVVPQKRFQHINLDLVSLPPSNGCRYLLTAVDRFSRWPVAIPIRDATSESVLDAFAHGWVATYGVPASITTDRGSQFLSATWTQLMDMWGIKSHYTTPYHPSSNGLVERFHRRLKEALLALGTDHPGEWYWRLPCVLLSIRTTLKPDVGASPADLVYGEGLSVPGDLLGGTPPSDEESHRLRSATLANLRLEVARLRPIATSAHRRPRIHVPEPLLTATHVFIRRGGVQPSFTTPYTGPYRVVSRQENSFRVALPGGSTDSISISRLKPAFTSSDENDDDSTPSTPPSPPPPGRRPGVRTRSPEPTDRQTRSASDNPLGFDPGEGSSRLLLGRGNTHQSEIPQPAPPSSLHRSLREQSPFSDEGDSPPVNPPPPPPSTPRRGPRFFSDPNARKFSRTRPNVSYAAPLQAVLREHLGLSKT